MSYRSSRKQASRQPAFLDVFRGRDWKFEKKPSSRERDLLSGLPSAYFISDICQLGYKIHVVDNDSHEGVSYIYVHLRRGKDEVYFEEDARGHRLVVADKADEIRKLEGAWKFDVHAKSSWMRKMRKGQVRHSAVIG